MLCSIFGDFLVWSCLSIILKRPPQIYSIFDSKKVWEPCVVSSVTENVCNLKKKIRCRSVKSISSEHEVKSTMFTLKEDFVIIPSDKVANKVAFICKYLCTLTVIKELNLDCHLANQDDNHTYTFIDTKTGDQIIAKHKLYLSKQN